MTELQVQQVLCEGPHDVVSAMNAIIPTLPPDVRSQLNNVKLSYLQRYGVGGLYDRVNRKTVATIIAEFDEGNALQQIASGEIEGVRYELFKAPETEPGQKGRGNRDRSAL